MSHATTIPGYNGRYEITEEGEVFAANYAGSGERKKVSQYLTAGYPSVSLLCQDGRRRTTFIHRLLAEVFLGGIPYGLEVNHKDGNKQNNHIANLELISHQENIRHSAYTLNNESAIPKSAVISEDPLTGKISIYRSCAEAVKSGFSQSGISKCCLGLRSQHKGLKWYYADPDNTAGRRGGHKTRVRKPVTSIQIATGQTKDYPSVSATKVDGFNPASVHKCCSGGQKEHLGHYWRFSDPDTEYSRGVVNKKPVIGYNQLTGETVEFSSVAEAAAERFEMTGIVKCCRGQQLSHRGFEWRYR